MAGRASPIGSMQLGATPAYPAIAIHSQIRINHLDLINGISISIPIAPVFSPLHQASLISTL